MHYCMSPSSTIWYNVHYCTIYNVLYCALGSFLSLVCISADANTMAGKYKDRQKQTSFLIGGW